MSVTLFVLVVIVATVIVIQAIARMVDASVTGAEGGLNMSRPVFESAPARSLLVAALRRPLLARSAVAPARSH